MKLVKPFILLDAKDNVATAISEMSAGFVVDDDILTEPVVCRETIPRGHKVALSDLDKDSLVVKYGVTIGRTTAAIAKGELVHVHNVKSLRGKGKDR